MDLKAIPLFNLLTTRMTWLSSRQAVLSENVAHADTPNYVARDLPQLDFQRMLAQQQQTGTSLATTDPRHIMIRNVTGPFAPENATGEGGTPGGNVVSLEQEMIKLSDTQMQYQTATNLYQKAVNMFRTALGGRSG
jgi:flagellar basal-body rod protein FlgB